MGLVHSSQIHPISPTQPGRSAALMPTFLHTTSIAERPAAAVLWGNYHPYQFDDNKVLTRAESYTGIQRSNIGYCFYCCFICSYLEFLVFNIIYIGLGHPLAGRTLVKYTGHLRIRSITFIALGRFYVHFAHAIRRC